MRRVKTRANRILLYLIKDIERITIEIYKYKMKHLIYIDIWKNEEIF